MFNKLEKAYYFSAKDEIPPLYYAMCAVTHVRENGDREIIIIFVGQRIGDEAELERGPMAVFSQSQRLYND